MSRTDYFLTAIIGVVMVAVLVSKSSKTSDAISAFGNMIASLVRTLMGPLNQGASH